MTERPVRRMDPWAEQFWAYTQNREFRLQRCVACEKVRWPPAPVCDRCLSEDAGWDEMTGTGTLLSWVTFHRQYFAEYPPPHCVVTVELTEGPLFISTPAGIAPEELRAGMPMAVTWHEAHDQFGEYHLPVFVPAGDQHSTSPQ